MHHLSLNAIVMEADACLFEGPRWPLRRPRTGEAVGLASFLLRTCLPAQAEGSAALSASLQLAAGLSPALQAQELADPHLLTLTLGGPGVYAGCAQLDLRGPPPVWVGCDAALELRRFRIDHSAHGDSLAVELLEKVCETARGRGALTLWLRSWPGLGEGEAFFRRQGFEDGHGPVGLGAAPKDGAWQLRLRL